jgi:hypothetical protein
MSLVEDRPVAELVSEDITDAQAAQFAKTGWVAARGFFTPLEVAAISAWTDELLAMPEVPGEHMVYYEKSLREPAVKVVQRIENFCPYHAAFDRLVRGDRLRRAAARLMGGEAILFKEKVNFKMPGGAGFEPHQDQQAGWTVFTPMFVTALVSIDRATTENGCLEMTDAPRFAGLIGREWTPLTDEEMASFSLISVPTEPGDVLFFDSYAPHASKPNLTDAARRILYLTYNLKADGDHRARYYAEKRANFPPDIERAAGAEYTFRV